MRRAEVRLIWRFLQRYYDEFQGQKENGGSAGLQAEVVSSSLSDCKGQSLEPLESFALFELSSRSFSLSFRDMVSDDTISELLGELYFYPGEVGYFQGCVNLKLDLKPGS